MTPNIEYFLKTSLRFFNFLTDEQEYCETLEIHQRQHWSTYLTCATLCLIPIFDYTIHGLLIRR